MDNPETLITLSKQSTLRILRLDYLQCKQQMDNPEKLATLSTHYIERILRFYIPAIQKGNEQSRETSNIEYTLHRTNITFLHTCNTNRKWTIQRN